MAIAKFKKVRLVAHQSWQKQLTSALQEWGMLQLIDVRDQLTESVSLPEWEASPIATGDNSAEESQARIKSALDYLRRYDTKTEGLIDSFMGLKEKLTQEAMDDIIHHYDGLEVATRFSRYDKRLSEIANQLNRLQGEQGQLIPWSALDYAPGKLSELESVEATLGILPASQYESFVAKLAEATEQMTHVEQIGRNSKDCMLLVLQLRHDQAASQVLRESALARVSLPRPDLTPRAAMAEIDAEMQSLNRERDEIVSDSKAGLQDKVKLQALYDYYGQQRQKTEVQRLMLNTSQVFLLEGWLEAQRQPEFERLMAEQFSEVVMFVSDPEEQDNPPIVLQNSGAATPFEFVMNVYGWPSYREIDPTPILAPFFALFFAIALGDAGYGLLLVLGSLWFMRKYDLDKYGKKFFRLFIMCGALTMVVGLTLNGVFGNLLDALQITWLVNLKNSVVLLDPMSNPLGMMALTVVLGVIQVWTGYAVKAYGAWRSGDKASALLDSGPWMLWIAALTFFALTSTLAPLKGLAPIGKYAAIVGALGIVLTQGRGAKNIVGKLGGGLYALYNTVGPFSDTLSYTRLLALGLSGGVIAMVVNTFAVMLKDIPFVGWLLMLVLLVFGHLFNIALSLLGCFIHSARLQYVEFFTKFFEGGGVPFRPFRRESKYTMIKE